MTAEKKYKRVNLFFDADSLETLDKLVRLLGMNRSQFVRNLVNEAAPSFERLTKELETLQAKTDEERARTLKKLERIADSGMTDKALDYLEGK